MSRLLKSRRGHDSEDEDYSHSDLTTDDDLDDYSEEESNQEEYTTEEEDGDEAAVDNEHIVSKEEVRYQDIEPSSSTTDLKEKRIQEHRDYRKKLAEDPSFVPYVGSFWGHDDRYREDSLTETRPVSDNKPHFSNVTESSTSSIKRDHRQYDHHLDPLMYKKWDHSGYEELLRLEEQEERQKKDLIDAGKHDEAADIKPARLHNHHYRPSRGRGSHRRDFNQQQQRPRYQPKNQQEDWPELSRSNEKAQDSKPNLDQSQHSWGPLDESKKNTPSVNDKQATSSDGWGQVNNDLVNQNNNGWDNVSEKGKNNTASTDNIQVTNDNSWNTTTTTDNANDGWGSVDTNNNNNNNNEGWGSVENTTTKTNNSWEVKDSQEKDWKKSNDTNTSFGSQHKKRSTFDKRPVKGRFNDQQEIRADEKASASWNMNREDRRGNNKNQFNNQRKQYNNNNNQYRKPNYRTNDGYKKPNKEESWDNVVESQNWASVPASTTVDNSNDGWGTPSENNQVENNGWNDVKTNNNDWSASSTDVKADNNDWSALPQDTKVDKAGWDTPSKDGKSGTEAWSDPIIESKVENEGWGVTPNVSDKNNGWTSIDSNQNDNWNVSKVKNDSWNASSKSPKTDNKSRNASSSKKSKTKKEVEDSWGATSNIDTNATGWNVETKEAESWNGENKAKTWDQQETSELNQSTTDKHTSSSGWGAEPSADATNVGWDNWNNAKENPKKSRGYLSQKLENTKEEEPIVEKKETSAWGAFRSAGDEDSDVEIILEAEEEPEWLKGEQVLGMTAPTDHDSQHSRSVESPINTSKASPTMKPGYRHDVNKKTNGRKPRRNFEENWRQRDDKEDQYRVNAPPAMYYPPHQMNGGNIAFVPMIPNANGNPMYAMPIPMGASSNTGTTGGSISPNHGSDGSSPHQKYYASPPPMMTGNGIQLPPGYEANGMVYYGVDPSAIYAPQPFYYYTVPMSGNNDNGSPATYTEERHHPSTVQHQVEEDGWGPSPEVNDSEEQWASTSKDKNRQSNSMNYNASYYYYPPQNLYK